jgi:hypothetical protein
MKLIHEEFKQFSQIHITKKWLFKNMQPMTSITLLFPVSAERQYRSVEPSLTSTRPSLITSISVDVSDGIALILIINLVTLSCPHLIFNIL